jgi:uncharacterized RDD family membrane protein YckC
MEEPNVYAPPQADVNAMPAGALEDAMDASTGQRFATWFVDYLAIMVVSAIMGVVIGLAGQASLLDGFGANIFGIVVMLGYYVAMEATTGRTVGKMVAGTRVIRMDGSKPGALTVLGRTAARFIPFEPFSAFGGGQMWHDSMSKTRVITTRGPKIPA